MAGLWADMRVVQWGALSVAWMVVMLVERMVV